MTGLLLHPHADVPHSLVVMYLSKLYLHNDENVAFVHHKHFVNKHSKCHANPRMSRRLSLIG